MMFQGKTEIGLALVSLFLESHSFSLRQPSGARGTFSVVSGGAETAILSAQRWVFITSPRGAQGCLFVR